MKRFNIALLLLLILFFVYAERRKAAVHAASSHSTHDHENASPTAGDAAARVPAFQLTNHLGEAFGSDDLRGKPWIANFIFTRCKLTCPAQTQRMLDIQDRLESAANDGHIQFVSITVDPDYDTVSVLKTYADSHKTGENWWFLTGAKEAVRALSVDGFELGVGETANADAPLFHSPKFVLVDRDLTVRGYFDSGDETAVTGLVTAAGEMAKQ